MIMDQIIGTGAQGKKTWGGKGQCDIGISYHKLT